MPVEYGQSSRYAQEMRRWNAHHSEFGAPGRPYVFQEFPKRVYRADRVDGQVKIVESKEVGDDDAEMIERGKGFRFSQQDALDLITGEQLTHGRLAAEREWEIQHGKHSDKAIAEVRAVEAASSEHVPVIAETPIPAHQKKRRGRPRTTLA